MEGSVKVSRSPTNNDGQGIVEYYRREGGRGEWREERGGRVEGMEERDRLSTTTILTTNITTTTN